jgi:hypothetical protein
MTPPRVQIVRAEGSYRGMDRRRLSDLDVPRPLVLRGLGLEDAGSAAELLAWLADLAHEGITEYEVLSLGDGPGQEWELLGHDVGETTSAGWSAIAHRADFLPAAERAAWDERLNEYGLFGRREDAEDFLERYLAADDPDGGWTPEGWSDDPGIYAVVPVYLLSRT